MASLLLEISVARARAVNPEAALARVLAWLRDHDPLGTQTAMIVRELRRITGPDRLADADYVIEERLLATLTAPRPAAKP